MLQLFFHAAAKIAIFQCAGSIILLAHKTRVDELRGLGRRMPVTFICFALVSLSLVGIPPSAASTASGIWPRRRWTRCPARWAIWCR